MNVPVKEVFNSFDVQYRNYKLIGQICGNRERWKDVENLTSDFRDGLSSIATVMESLIRYE